MIETDVIVRKARVDELDKAAALRAEMAREHHDGDWDAEYPGWRTGFSEFFRRKQEHGDAQMYYAERAGEIVGMAAFSVLDEYRALAFGKPRGFVNSVFVVPSLRRRGVARELMRAGIEWLRGRGCVMVRLRTSDQGQGLYESLGFTPGREMELEL